MKSDSLTIQEKMDKLNELLNWFSSPDFKIDEAVDKYKELETTADDIEKSLNNMKNEINIIKKKFDQAK